MGSLITSLLMIIYLTGNQVNASTLSTSGAPDDVLKFMTGLISILLIIIGFFIVYYFNQQSSAYKELTIAISDLRETIAHRTQWEEDFEKRYEEHQKSCGDKYIKK